MDAAIVEDTPPSGTDNSTCNASVHMDGRLRYDQDHHCTYFPFFDFRTALDVRSVADLPEHRFRGNAQPMQQSLPDWWDGVHRKWTQLEAALGASASASDLRVRMCRKPQKNKSLTGNEGIQEGDS